MTHPVWYSPLVARAEARTPTIVVDLDGTIADDEFEELEANAPEEGAREALRSLVAAGYEIVIFTCRMNRVGRSDYEMNAEKRSIEKWLHIHDIPYTRIDEGYDGKPRGDVIIDNKAIRYEADIGWEYIADLILRGRYGTNK